MNIVEVTNDGYANGLRQGRASKPWKTSRLTETTRWVECLQEAGNYYSHHPKEVLIASVQQWTRDDALAYAEWLHRQQMDALPDLATFPELQGVDQYLDDEVRGIAEGAETTVAEVCLERYWREVLWHACGKPPQRPVANCSEIVLFDPDGHPIIGKGWDDIHTWYDPKDYKAPPKTFEMSLTRQAEGRGYSHIGPVNEKGVAWEQGGGPLYAEPWPDDILFPVPTVDILLRHCATTDEVVELMTRYADFWGPCNAVAVDANGNTALFEKSRTRCNIVRGQRKAVFTTYGGCEGADVQEMTDPSSDLFRFYRGRMKRMAQTVERDEGRCTVQTMWDMLLDHDPDGVGSTCQHLDNRPPGVDLFCMGAIVTSVGEGRCLRRTISYEGDQIRYACQNAASEGRFHWP